MRVRWPFSPKQHSAAATPRTALQQKPAAPGDASAIVTLFGLSEQQVADFLEDADSLERKYDRVQYVISAPAVHLFARRKIAAELISNQFMHSNGCNADTFTRYLLSRWRIILSKWKPDVILNYGMTFEEYSRPGNAQSV